MIKTGIGTPRSHNNPYFIVSSVSQWDGERTHRISKCSIRNPHRPEACYVRPLLHHAAP
jgi:hypothetical protein